MSPTTCHPSTTRSPLGPRAFMLLVTYLVPLARIDELLEVRSAAYARAAQWVVGGLFGVLVVLLGINFVRRRRPSAAPADGPGTGEEATDA